MNKTMKMNARRILGAVLLLVVLLTSLSGCGTAAKVTPPTASIIRSEDATASGCKLSSDTLNDLSAMLVNAYSDKLDTRALLIAAYRGYDMLAEDFDDSKIDPATTLTPNMD